MRFVPFRDLAPHQVDELRLIYESSFPSHQRVPLRELLDGAQDADRTQLAGLIDGSAAAMLVMAWLPSIGWWFLEYLAVAEQSRDRGLGTEIWNKAIRHASGDRPARIVFEVEIPEEAAPGSDELLQRQRRIRFYERVGAHRIGRNWFTAPKVTGEGVEHFHLMARPAEGEPLPTGQKLREIAAGILRDGYGLDRDSALVREAEKLD